MNKKQIIINLYNYKLLVIVQCDNHFGCVVLINWVSTHTYTHTHRLPVMLFHEIVIILKKNSTFLKFLRLFNNLQLFLRFFIRFL